jgi:hypothetical protein
VAGLAPALCDLPAIIGVGRESRVRRGAADKQYASPNKLQMTS